MKTDAAIQKEVIQELTWDPSVTHEHIGVAVNDGIVTLSGNIPTYIEKFSAERAAQRVSGVKAVVENIHVKLASDSKREDLDIAKALLQQMQWNVQIPDHLIKVQVEDGWVKLTGEVYWDYQRTLAETTARGLTGVQGVINSISLKSKNVQPDAVRKNIETALKRRAMNEAGRIAVAVSGGSVTLSGEVDSFNDRAEARLAAWSSPGVTSVENNLLVVNNPN